MPLQPPCVSVQGERAAGPAGGQGPGSVPVGPPLGPVPSPAGPGRGRGTSSTSSSTSSPAAATSLLSLSLFQASKLGTLLKEAERRCEQQGAELSTQVLEVQRSRADMEELLQHNSRLQKDSEEHQVLRGAYNALLNRSEGGVTGSSSNQSATRHTSFKSVTAVYLSCKFLLLYFSKYRHVLWDVFRLAQLLCAMYSER